MFLAPARAHSPAFRSSDRSFERFVNDAFFSNAHRGFKVEQDEKAWTVTLDLPGVAKDELSIAIEGSIVRIETHERSQAPVQGRLRACPRTSTPRPAPPSSRTAC